MAVEIVTVPDLGGAETVDVIELSIAQGDAVALEDSLLVLESDKATMDVPSPFAGTLVKFLVADGDTVKVGDPIAEIEVAGQQAEASAEPAKAAADTAAAVIEEQPEPVKQPEAATVSAEQAGGLAEQLILVPDIGSEDQIDVIEISVAIGDQVEEGDTLLVLESDKATMDVPSSHSGTVIKIIAAEGDKLTTGSEVAVLQVSQTSPNAEPAPVAELQAPQAVVEPTAQPAIVPQAPAPVQTIVDTAAPNESGEVYAGPAVRMLARELGVDLSQVSGTGPRGRVQKDDVNLYVKSALRAAPAAATGSGIPLVPAVDFSQYGEIESIPMSKIQKLTAANMQRNWLNVPHVTHFDDADITDLEDFRKSLADEGAKRGIKVTPVAFLIKALAAAMQSNPIFNRSLAADGEHFIQKHYCNIGMAVDTPRGLVVPVIKDADEKGIWDISADIAALAASARDGKLKPADMQGGCFTLSSLGAIGGKGFTPIVNSPEVGILGVSKSQMQPLWNGQEFVPRLMLPLCLSYDHRVVNGGDAGRFMTQLVKSLSDIRHLAL
ncbi:MAG: dihydrolipoyllysine-residue acetyltransferase [Porticoccaceae bacterium]|nr:dihydrolipoyllysine-residue acetyltransferase [Porticoccaceae bacterium]MBT7258153.1 dihydrolipoyllysine-residue acetyltransferase [Porticoccaceae bacterium]MBT7904685.1 dihydrolipoyllysine-residue acetyltransferase [Porticoccaceae bacterium]MDB2480955.1 dihydrolipoyllysine-residue acetyltransferase [Porticoccaceae bacterium]